MQVSDINPNLLVINS